VLRIATLRFIVAVALAPLAVALAPASAVGAPVALVPNVAGQATRLEVDADPRVGAPNAETPQSVTIAVARGLRIETRARARRCSQDQARRFACPESSRIGRGHVETTIGGYLQPGGSFDAIAAIDLYLAPAPQPGDIAGVVAQVTELVSGARTFVRGRLILLPRGRFGTELRFGELPGARLGDPIGVRATVKRLRLFVWAARSVKVRTRAGGVERVRFNLLNNPSRCARSWPYEVRARFSGGEVKQDGQVACAR
jgi:hypothetical protein